MKFRCIDDNREIIVNDKATIERYKGYPDKFELIEETPKIDEKVIDESFFKEENEETPKNKKKK